MSLSTAEMMALAVLKGDPLAARALADHLLEDVQGVGAPLPPVRKLSVSADRLRVVLYAADGVHLDAAVEHTEAAVRAWLDGERPLMLTGIDRAEVYELPWPSPGDGIPAARVIGSAVHLEHPGDPQRSATWGERDHDAARWMADRIATATAIAKAVAVATARNERVP